MQNSPKIAHIRPLLYPDKRDLNLHVSSSLFSGKSNVSAVICFGNDDEKPALSCFIVERILGCCGSLMISIHFLYSSIVSRVAFGYVQIGDCFSFYFSIW